MIHRQLSQRLGGIHDGNLQQLTVRMYLLDDCGPSSPGFGVAKEMMAIYGLSRHGYEQIAWLHLSRIIADFADLDRIKLRWRREQRGLRRTQLDLVE